MGTRSRRSALILVLVSFGILSLACSSAAKGESCEDEGKIGGDCESGLMCARSKPDEVSALVCLKPCVEDANCESNETCSGERGRNPRACRAR
jgi:hypothetical protein